MDSKKERFNLKTNSRQTANPRVEAFLAAVLELSRKYGLSIGHEDCHGGFIIGQFSECDAEWLYDAVEGSDIEEDNSDVQ